MLPFLSAPPLSPFVVELLALMPLVFSSAQLREAASEAVDLLELEAI